MASKFLLVAFFVAVCTANLTVLEEPTVQGFSACSLCVSLTTQTLSQLLNIALNLGVVRECSQLCSGLSNTLEVAACSFLCDIAGVKLFVKALDYVDLDPIYYCEEISACPHGDEESAADMLSLGVYPDSGKRGTEFVIGSMFNVTHATGTGKIEVRIDKPHGGHISGQSLNEGFEPGMYSIRFSLDTNQKDEHGFYAFKRGEYNVTLTICQGNCVSHHPWTKVLAQGQTSFTIV